MTEKIDNSVRTSLVMNPAVAGRLQQLVEQTRASSANALLSAVIAKIDPEMAQLLYRQAVAEGVVRPKTKTDPVKAALLERAKHLTAEQLQELLDGRLK